MCFSLCFVPLRRQSCLHGNRCSLCVAFALGKSMPTGDFSLLSTPPPQFGIKERGGGRWGMDRRPLVAWSARGGGWGVTVSPPAWDSQDVVLGLASPSGLRHVCHEAVRWSTQWFVDTQPSWTHCILRGSCWPPGAGGWLGKLALAPILWQDLEGEDSDPFGPWFLPRA